jgi:hypothetical protein
MLANALTAAAKIVNRAAVTTATENVAVIKPNAVLRIKHAAQRQVLRLPQLQPVLKNLLAAKAVLTVKRHVLLPQQLVENAAIKSNQ